PTAPVINIDQDNTWVPGPGGELHQRQPEPPEEDATLNLDATAQLGPDVLHRPDTGDDTLHEPPPPRAPSRPAASPPAPAPRRPRAPGGRPPPRPPPPGARPPPGRGPPPPARPAPARAAPAPARSAAALPPAEEAPAVPEPEAPSGSWLATLLGVVALIVGA